MLIVPNGGEAFGDFDGVGVGFVFVAYMILTMEKKLFSGLSSD